MYKSKERFNVYFRGMNLSGGAPRSSYEYLSVLKQSGACITVIADEKDKKLTEQYKSSFDRFLTTVYGYDLFEKRNFTGLIRLLKKEYKMLKKERPDLVIILGHFNAFFYSRFCNRLAIPAVVLIAGGDLSGGVNLLKDCPCDHVICFSEENREVLLRCIDNERITVIANRIKLKTVFNDEDRYSDLNGSDCVNILFTSRIDADKYGSVYNFIKITNETAVEGRRILLTIAGDGSHFDKLKKFVDTLNNPFLQIELKGHVDNLIPEFEKSHIVIGKGRSVIEPIMMNRIGCVMGDDGKIEVCTAENFERLYHYNFSGRNLNCDNPQFVLENLIDSMMSCTYDTEEMKSSAEITRRFYSSEYLADKLHNVLDNMKCEKQRKNRVSALGLVLKLFRIKISDKIRKGKSK